MYECSLQKVVAFLRPGLGGPARDRAFEGVPGAVDLDGCKSQPGAIQTRVVEEEGQRRSVVIL